MMLVDRQMDQHLSAHVCLRMCERVFVHVEEQRDVRTWEEKNKRKEVERSSEQEMMIAEGEVW